jgi:hypothetical protein
LNLKIEQVKKQHSLGVNSHTRRIFKKIPIVDLTVGNSRLSIEFSASFSGRFRTKSSTMYHPKHMATIYRKKRKKRELPLSLVVFLW